MDAWLKAAVDYIPDWLEYQMRETGQPGCVIAIAHKGRVVSWRRRSGLPISPQAGR